MGTNYRTWLNFIQNHNTRLSQENRQQGKQTGGTLPQASTAVLTKVRFGT